MLSKLITKDLIRLKICADTWQDALRKSGELLVEKGKITDQYIEDMIDAVVKYGPYIAIAPHIALGHAAPSESVIEECMCLVTLDSPVKIGHEFNDPIQIVFVFGAKEPNSHLAAISSLAMFLSDDRNIRLLETSSSVDEVLQAISQY